MPGQPSEYVSCKFSAMPSFTSTFYRLVPFYVLLLCACAEDKPVAPPAPEPDASSHTACVYVLCEGLYGMNNTRLFAWNVRDGQVEPDIFSKVNQRGLGDTGNDLLLYGGKIYVVMSGSNTVEVIEAATARSLRQIPFTNEAGVGRQPRYACAAEGKVYVCCFDGSVIRIDTASLQAEASVKAGSNPDGICHSANKLYVSNSGGLSFPHYDSTVSVIDRNSFTEKSRIAVGRNPYTIAADSRDYVYVCTRGDYDGLNQKSEAKREAYNFYRIDTQKDSVDRVYNIPVLDFCLYRDTAYLYNFDYNANTFWIGVFDLKTESFVSENFIRDGTKLQKPYSISVEPGTGKVYIGEAYNHLSSGSLYVFSPQGKMQSVLHGLGLNPTAMVFLQEKD